jgi:hypothetical protein
LERLETKEGVSFTVGIGEYGYPSEWDKVHQPLFSYFKHPIEKKPPITPYRSITLLQLHRAITGKHYQTITEKAHQLYQEYLATGSKKAYSQFKKTKLDYVTFCGEFSRKADDGFLRHSSYVCFDFDRVKEIPGLKAALLKDPYFETQLLFVSPSGDGLKWVVSLEGHGITGHPPRTWFLAVQNYILSAYGHKIDNSPDPSRACFVAADPQAIIHPKYLQ